MFTRNTALGTLMRGAARAAREDSWRRKAQEDIAREMGVVAPDDPESYRELIEGAARVAVDLALTTSTTAVSPIGFSGLASDLISMLSGADRRIERKLATIDFNVATLLAGPFRAGQQHLAAAHRNLDDFDVAHNHLRSANTEFMRAHGLANPGLQTGSVEMHLGLISLVSGQSREASHWLSAAHDSYCSSVRSAIGEVQTQEKPYVPKPWESILVANPATVVVAAADSWSDARKSIMIDERMSLINSIAPPAIRSCARTVNAIEGKAVLAEDPDFTA